MKLELPIINLKIPIRSVTWIYTPKLAKKAKIKIAGSNSFDFGGTNGSLILRKLTE